MVELQSRSLNMLQPPSLIGKGETYRSLGLEGGLETYVRLCQVDQASRTSK